MDQNLLSYVNYIFFRWGHCIAVSLLFSKNCNTMCSFVLIWAGNLKHYVNKWYHQKIHVLKSHFWWHHLFTFCFKLPPRIGTNLWNQKLILLKITFEKNHFLITFFQKLQKEKTFKKSLFQKNNLKVAF